MSIKKSRLLPFIVIFMSAVFLLLETCAFADTAVAVSVSGNEVTVDSELAVTVGFTADDTIGTVQAAVSYNESYLEFVSGDGAIGGGGIVNISDFPDSEASSMTVTLTFKALKTGSTTINLTNGTIISPDGLSLGSSLSGSANITIADGTSTTESYTDSTVVTDNADSTGSTAATSELVAQLKSLTVGEGVLQPAFSPDIYEYTVTVRHEVNKFDVEGETGSPTDTIWYAGSFYLADGKNQQTVTVTSADKTVSNVYTINIYRMSEDESSIAESNTDSIYNTDSVYSSVAESSEASISENTSGTASSRAVTIISNSTVSQSGSEDLRDKLMPAMYIAAGVIILAAAILIIWIKSKSKNKLK